ncbi:hypothetical protein WB401_38085 [Streptomyces brasiliscabiei]|uniref:Secreted protein n=2 Tax=Streptomyces TaxID=1883 RepID=A0ABU8GTX2_9ACTN|nr:MULTISPECIES: hypothetical protein [Streptomyces]MBZ3903448.1 hypothetical protein [Streptomyces griseiscabiei]MDX2912191.1 hypothetical protein [Streptomyces griseiscabiei]
MSVSLAVAHLVPLAKEVDEDKVTPGVLGFIVFAVMALAVWGLMKSMNKQMAKVDFKESPDPDAPVGETTTDAAGKSTPAKS